MSELFLLAIILFCFILAGFAPLIYKINKDHNHWLYSFATLGVFVFFLTLAPQVWNGETFFQRLIWIDSLNIHLSFWLDGLGLFFSLLILFIGALVFFYSGSYFTKESSFGRFNLLLLSFVASMLGLVLSADLITTFVFWELTTLTSFLLIGFNYSQGAARKAAKKALLITGGSGLCLLAGFILLIQATGSANYSEIFRQRELILSHPQFETLLILILIGAFAKSAQFPFHFWLPSAMAAPAPVSAYLHSATMVKAGIFLLARLTPVFGGTELWTQSLVITGGITMSLAVVMCLVHKDLKLILAYLTVLVLGLLTLLLGISGEIAIQAALLYIVVHALYKAALFLNVGIIDHLTGTRDVDQLRGLSKVLKYPALSILVAVFSMIGLIPFLGFIGKEMVLKALADSSEYGAWFLTLIMIGVTAVAGVILKPLLGKNSTPVSHPASFSFWMPPALLAGLGLVFGFYPTFLNTLIQSASSAVSGSVVNTDIYLWHGLNKEFGFSLLSVLLGIVLYFNLSRIYSPLNRLQKFSNYLGPQIIYETGLRGLNHIASFITYKSQNGSLRFYLWSIALSFIIILSLSLNIFSTPIASLALPNIWYPPDHYEWLAIVLTTVGAIVASISRSVIAVFVGLGTSGYGIVLTFMFYGMPDLALTQFLVEIFTVIMIALVFVTFPSGINRSRKVFSWGDAVLASTFGLVIVIAIFQVLAEPAEFPAADFYKQQSYLQAHGRNVVNTILVDFRSLDTLGEAAVILLAATGVISLYKLNPKAKKPLTRSSDEKSHHS